MLKERLFRRLGGFLFYRVFRDGFCFGFGLGYERLQCRSQHILYFLFTDDIFALIRRHILQQILAEFVDGRILLQSFRQHGIDSIYCTLVTLDGVDKALDEGFAQILHRPRIGHIDGIQRRKTFKLARKQFEFGIAIHSSTPSRPFVPLFFIEAPPYRKPYSTPKLELQFILQTIRESGCTKCKKIGHFTTDLFQPILYGSRRLRDTKGRRIIVILRDGTGLGRLRVRLASPYGAHGRRMVLEEALHLLRANGSHLLQNRIILDDHRVAKRIHPEGVIAGIKRFLRTIRTTIINP